MIPEKWEELLPLRKSIRRIGADAGWETLPMLSHREPVPFDEAMLGLVGL